jgi:hypothetical protein
MSKYANQTLHDPKTGETVDVQTEFTELAIIVRAEGHEIGKIVCKDGHAEVLVPVKPASMTDNVQLSAKDKRDIKDRE